MNRDKMFGDPKAIERAWMARPDPIYWYAVLVFWLICLDLGAIAAIALVVLR